jgi:peptidoglycan/LPS O-acetylase OafA/YrhL
VPDRLSTYRQDVEALRGISILAVLLYHLFPATLPSGYLGVDLFLVVSGFLMASLYGEVDGRSLGEFLRRRAWRLLPAYAVIVVFTLAAAGLVLFPYEFAVMKQSAVYAALLMPNVGFWLGDTYFQANQIRPLLHLWSLGLEIQFYLLFPLLALAWRRVRWMVPVVVVISLAACLVMVEVSPTTAFFLLPFRLWEFGLGFLAAKVLASRRLRPWIDRIPWAGCVGLLGVCVLMAAPDLSQNHPGWIALVTCGAAVVFLAVGAPAAVMRSLPGRGLARLGRYSYALYLVHYPVICLLFYRPFEGWRGAAGGPFEIGLALAMIAVLTLALHHFVEQPARRGLPVRRLIGAALVGVGFLTAAAFAEPAWRHVRFTAEEAHVLAGAGDRPGERCDLIGVIPPVHRSCAMAEPLAGRPTILLIGDSHADSVREGLRRAALRAGFGLRIMTARCVVGRDSCDVAGLMREARATDAGVLVFAGLPSRFEPDAVAALVRTAGRENITPVMIDPIPVHDLNVVTALYWEARGAPAARRDTAAAYRARNRAQLAAAERLEEDGLIRIDTGALLCPRVCDLGAVDGTPWYFDANHLTLSGAARLEPAFDALLARLAGSDRADESSPPPA